MFSFADALRITRHTLFVTACMGALAMPGALAQEPSAPVRAVPNALLTIDQNRGTVIDRVVADWGEALAKSNAGIDAGQLRLMLEGMRADHLLAASLAGTLDGLRNVIAKALVATAPVKPSLIQAKALGDTTDDLVYTPVTPCRVVDSRFGGGGTLAAGDTRNWLAANPGGNFTAQGGSGTNCGIPLKPAAVLVNITVANTGPGPSFLTAWPFNQARPLASTLNWTAANSQIANAVIVPLCTGGGCTDDFSFYVGVGTDVIVDVAGYLASPAATAVLCTQIASASTPIPVSSDTLVALPSCTAGYTRTGNICTGAANVPSGYLLETNTTGCVFRNLSAVATYNAVATSICCQIPGH